ncbi:MAG: prepilin peptidase [Armatimonadota bacterium]
MELAVRAIAFIYGTVVGSFLNVCIYRMPRQESIIRPPSHCPDCGTRLRVRDLVPIVSFLVQRCRCRYCGSFISWRYLSVELLTGLYFALYTAKQGVSIDTVLALAFAAILIAAFFIDLEHYIIPDELNLVGVGIGLARDVLKLVVHDANWGLASVWLPILGRVHMPRSLVTAAGAAFALYVVAVLGTWMFRREAMGMGDVKLAAAIGANLTAGAALAGFFIAVLVGALVGVTLVLFRLRARQDLLPFGPFLAAGTLTAMVWGEQIFAYYTGLTGLG